ncbi:CDP-archaeol synthase [Roseiarcaceae bacterium H3SJ34-1]|uniref:CDP-archaeol synthase n=1 Tax=Terripilifer ovatus TaxID=3032367 RepID=UPI003AB9A041|nr:CDP-archaeol synthase [Roseiarcaceae bacterium H3SJ34-1]
MIFDLHPVPLFHALLLLAIANGSPVFAKKLLGERWATPLDCGLVMVDGQPLFGRSKTIRGLLVAIVLSTALALLLGLDAMTGALAGSSAMAGDLLSSFTKRRLKLPPSSMAPGIDQVPESLIPLMICAPRLGLSILDVALGTVFFWLGELILSRWLYALKIRDRPY